MKDNKAIMQNDYMVVGPVTREDVERTKRRFAAPGEYAGSHYESALFDETILMYHLIHRESGEPVGFMTIKNLLESLGNDHPANAFFAVEYVFVIPEYRGAGLGGLLGQTAATTAQFWLEEQLQQCQSGIRCMSSSHPVSKRGLAFSRKLDLALQQWCLRHEVTFMSSTMAA